MSSHVCRRGIHSSASRLANISVDPFLKYKPKAYTPHTALERASFQFKTDASPHIIDPNNPLTESNTSFALSLLQKAIQSPDRKKGSNILLSPLAINVALQQSGKDTAAQAYKALNLPAAQVDKYVATDYTSIFSNLQAVSDGSLSLAAASKDQVSATAVQEALKLHTQTTSESTSSSDLPFPAPNPLASTAKQATSHAPHCVSFAGYLAPRFALPRTTYPNYFMNSAGTMTSSHMLVKTGKMLYVEHEKFQMIELPYLNKNFVATIILPRFSSDRTLLDHPNENEYHNAKRTPSTVSDVLNFFLSDSRQFAHHLRYSSLMPGLLGMPAFAADHTVDTQKILNVSPSSSSSSFRSVLSISPFGLDVGAKALRSRPHQQITTFQAYCDHPFIFLIRQAAGSQTGLSGSANAPSNSILFAGMIDQAWEKPIQTTVSQPKEWKNYKEECRAAIEKLYA